MRKLLAGLALASYLFSPAFAHAAFTTNDSGLGKTGNAAYGSAYITANGNIAVFIGEKIIQPVLGLLGLLFLVLMIYAGILWMTAQGDPKQVAKAKEIIISSVIGAVIVASSYALTTAVFNALDSGNATGGGTSTTGGGGAAGG